MESRGKSQTKFRQMILGLALAPVMILGSTTFAQVSGLELTIAIDKPQIELGEPVYLTAMLKNTGSESIAVYPSLYPEDNALLIEITDPQGRTRGFVPYSIDFNDLVAEDLAPGQLLSAAFPVFYGGRGWTFRSPGQYRILGRLVDPAQGKRLVESTPVRLTITSSGDSGQYLLQDGKASDEAGKFLLWQSGDHLRAGISHLEDLIDRYPNSVLADYARLAFAHNLSRPFRDYAIGKLRAPDPDAAIRLLDDVQTDRLPLYLQVDYIITRSLSLEVQGKTSESSSVLEGANSIIEQNPALNPLLEQIQ